MHYEYIRDLFNVNPAFSSTARLWKKLGTSNYYISYDQCETSSPTLDTSYLLLSDNCNRKAMPYRDNLSQNAKCLTALDFLNGTVEYNNSYWKLN